MAQTIIVEALRARPPLYVYMYDHLCRNLLIYYLSIYLSICLSMYLPCRPAQRRQVGSSGHAERSNGAVRWLE